MGFTMQRSRQGRFALLAATTFGGFTGFSVKLVGMVAYALAFVKHRGEALDVWVGVPNPRSLDPGTELGAALILVVIIPLMSGLTGGLVGAFAGYFGCRAASWRSTFALGAVIGAAGAVPGLLIVVGTCVEHPGLYFPTGVIPVVGLGVAAGVGAGVSGRLLGGRPRLVPLVRPA